MTWRPENWKNSNTLCRLAGEYEAGADAMLEALMKQNITPGVFYSGLHKAFGKHLTVFIPSSR